MGGGACIRAVNTSQGLQQPHLLSGGVFLWADPRHAAPGPEDVPMLCLVALALAFCAAIFISLVCVAVTIEVQERRRKARAAMRRQRFRPILIQGGKSGLRLSA